MSGLKILVPMAAVIVGIFGVLLVLLKITGTGGNNNGATPMPTARPLPSSTPSTQPTRHIPTPQFLTPTPAAQGGRPDCQLDWYVYRDPDGHFSLCYPPTWSAVAGSSGADLGIIVTLMTADNGGLLTMYWRPASYFSSPNSDRCGVAPAWGNAHQITVDVLGKSVSACTGDETQQRPDAPPLLGTFAEIPVAPGGYLTMFWFQPQGAGDAAERDTLTTVLDSAKLAE